VHARGKSRRRKKRRKRRRRRAAVAAALVRSRVCLNLGQAKFFSARKFCFVL